MLSNSTVAIRSFSQIRRPIRWPSALADTSRYPTDFLVAEAPPLSNLPLEQLCHRRRQRFAGTQLLTATSGKGNLNSGTRDYGSFEASPVSPEDR